MVMQYSPTMPIWAEFAKISSMVNWGNPLPLCLGSIQTKNPSQLSSIRYMMVSSMQLSWYLYGLETQNDTVILTSYLGCIVFYFYAVFSTMMKKEYQMLGVFTVGLLLQYISLLQFKTEQLGIICSMVQCIAAMTPIDIILKTVRTKDQSILNPLSILLNLPACFIWSGYGIVLNEFVIFLPNFIEFVLVFIQSILFVVYSIKNHSQEFKLDSKQSLYVKGGPNYMSNQFHFNNNKKEEEQLEKVKQQDYKNEYEQSQNLLDQSLGVDDKECIYTNRKQCSVIYESNENSYSFEEDMEKMPILNSSQERQPMMESAKNI